MRSQRPKGKKLFVYVNLHVYCWQLCIDLGLNERSHVRKLEQCSNLQGEEEEVERVEEDEAEEEEGKEEE